MKPSVARRAGSFFVLGPSAACAAPGLSGSTGNQTDASVRPDAIRPDAVWPDAVWPVRENPVGPTGRDGGTIETDRGIGGTGVVATQRATERGIGGTGIGGERLARAAITRDPASTSGAPAMAAVGTSSLPAPDPIVKSAESSSQPAIRGSR